LELYNDYGTSKPTEQLLINLRQIQANYHSKLTLSMN